MMDIAGRFDLAREIYGEHPALVDGTRSWAASELHDAASRLAAALIDLGVRPGDRIVVSLPLCGETIVAARAIWRSGAVVVPVSAEATDTQVVGIVEACAPVAIICLPDNSAMSVVAGRVAHRIGTGPKQDAGGALTLEQLVAAQAPLAASIPREATDLAQITFTSGTTGTPRGVAETHGSIDRLLRRFEPVMRRTPLDKLPVIVSALSPAAFGGVMLRHGLMGMSKLVAMATFDPQLFLAAIERERATIIGGVPSMFEALLACPDIDARDCSSLRQITVGGAYVSQSLLDRMQRRFGIRPTATYGSTEAGGAIVSRDRRCKPGSAGRILPGVEVKVIDETGITLPAGSAGEICTKTPWAAQSYYNDPEGTAAVFSDGWIRTGDVGYLDAGGELFLLGRRKDIIIQNGTNLYPLEIAEVLERHAAVRECVVAGIPNEVTGEEAVACVVLRDSTLATEHELLAHCGRHLDPRRMPARVQFVPSIPRTSLGKPDVPTLREALLAARSNLAETDAARRVRSLVASRRRSLIQELIAHEVLEELRALHSDDPSTDAIDPGVMLGDAGLTSLGAVRLAAQLGELFGRRLPATLLFSHPSVDRLTDAIVELFPEGDVAPSPVQPIGAASVTAEPVTIVGMACRLPGETDTPDAFWQLLRDGVNATGEWAVERGAEPADAPGAQSQRLRPRGAFVPRVDLFDARFFDLAGTAAGIDPQHRLLLETTWEALERAGLDPLGLRDVGAGVFVGISGTSYRSADALGVAPGMAVSRLCHFLDLHGPALTIDTTCSSSLVALHVARESLLRGECSIAIVAGVNVNATSTSFFGLTQLGVLAPDGRTKAFDARADGFGLGEGCVVLVLRRQGDALAAGARIHALVRGSAINHDGRSSSVTAPNPAAQEAVIRAALAAAHTAPAAVQYVEAHGTGTLLGDPIEVRALASVFADRPSRLAIGSVKTNIGHLEAGAGLAGVLKTVLALRHRELPASVSFETPNPHIPWDTIPVAVQSRRSRWPDDNAKLIAGVSAFGLSGTNAHVVLEEAPPRGTAALEAVARVHLLPLSARTPEALVESARRYAAALSKPESTARSARDVAFTASCGRAHLEYRLAVVGHSEAEWRTKLLAYAAEAAPARARPPQRGVAMVFSGQGPHWWGMGRELLADEPVFRDALHACAERIDLHAGWSLLDELARDEADSRLSETEFAQPALFALQVALHALWRSWGVEPAAVVGHSLGEIAAAHVAGAIALDDAARLVVVRGRVLQRMGGRGRMAAAEVEADEACRLVGEIPGVEVAAVNALRQVTIGGEPGAVGAALRLLRSRGVACRELRGSVAFHTAHVDACAHELAASLGSWRAMAPRIRFVSTMAGAEGDPPVLDAAYWGAQVRRPVRFDRAISTLLGDGYDTFVEVGPHPVLLPAIAEALEARAGARATLAPSLRRGAPERATMLEALGALYTAGLPVEWNRLYSERGRVVDLPTYPWQRESYWIDQTRPRRAVAAVPRGDAAGAQTWVAPLLARHMRLADPSGTHVFESDLDLRHPRLAYLADHRVEGEIWFPAAGVLELVLEAAGLAGAWPRLALRDVHFVRALTLEAESPRRVQLVLRREHEAAPMAFRLFSRAGGTDARDIEHAYGVVDVDAGVSHPYATLLDLEAIRTRCVQRLDLMRLYDGLGRAGFDFGPGFRGLATLWSGQGEAMGALQAADALGDAASYRVHPTWLDACFQTLAGVRSQDARAGVPVALDELVVHAPAQEAAWAYACRRSGDAATLPVTDFWMLDAHGRVLVEARGLRLGALGSSSEGFVYELAWREQPSPSRRTAAGTWLVVLDRGGVGEALRGALETRGADVVCAADPGDDFDRVLVEHFPESPPAAIVHVGSLDVPRNEATDHRALATAEHAGCISVMHLAQAVARRGWKSAPKLFVVTRGAQPATGSVSSVAQAPVWGFVASLAREMPELRSTLLDLDPDSADLSSLLAELESGDEEDRIAVRGGRRYVPRLVPRPPGDVQRAGPMVHPDRTYLITGGLGGLGLVVAERLAARGARYLALLGRSAPSGRAATSVAGLEASGVRVMVVRADVAIADDLGAALQNIESDLPPIAGIVHAAGVMDGAVIGNLSEARVRTMMEGKLFGAWNLHEWSRDRPLDFFVLFASVAGVLGSAGQAPYAAANVFLDALAHARRAAGLPGQSVDWGGWAEVGAAMRRGDTAGASPTARGLLTPTEGADLFERLLADSSAVQVIVWRFTPQQLRRSGRRGAAPPLLRDLVGASAAESRVRRGARDAIAARPPAERAQAVRDYVRRAVARLAAETPDRISVDERFEMLGLDSLALISLRRAVQAELGVQVPTAILFEQDTVATLGAWVHRELFAATCEAVPRGGGPLVALRTGGAAPPLFLVHAVGGGVHAYRALADALDRRVYAFEALGLHDEGRPVDSMEAMAARYTDELLAVQPDGPYLVAGWSFGGCVALEIAHALRARGGDVCLVALIESHHPLLARTPEGAALAARALWGAGSGVPAAVGNAGDLRHHRAAAVQFFLWDLAMQRGLSDAQRAAVHAAVAVAARMVLEGSDDGPVLSAIERTGLVGGVSGADVRRLLAVFEANAAAHARHLPRRYPGCALLVRAEDASAGEPDFGWRETLDDLHVVVVPGDHYSILRPPHVEQLAGVLRAHIDAALEVSQQRRRPMH